MKIAIAAAAALTLCAGSALAHDPHAEARAAGLRAAEEGRKAAEAGRRAHEHAMKAQKIAFRHASKSMLKGADDMMRGAGEMELEGRKLQSREYREEVIRDHSRRGRTVTHDELIRASADMRKGAQEMREGAGEMRRAAAEMADR